MPFSNDKHEGIENRIAELFGQKLGIPVEFFSFPQRLAFVRNTIRYKLPGQDYRCDVMLGVPQRFGQVSTTNAYYRSTYALVYRKGGKLDGVTSGEQFLKIARTAIDPKRLGIHDKSPASTWLSKYNLVELARLYQMMSPDPDAYPGQLISRDLVGGEIDAAIVWGPVAGYYGKKIKDPELVVVPLSSEPGVRFDFSIAMGVRHGEPQWKHEIQQLINQSGPEITAILREFGVPLVNDIGDLIPAANDPKVATVSKSDDAMKSSEAVSKQKQAAQLKAEHASQLAAAAKAAEQTAAAAKLAKEQAAAKQAATQAAAADAAKAAAATTQQPAAGSASAESASGADSLYTVKDGVFVDANTLAGFKTWRAAACDRCHGANQQGLVGPSLITSLKELTYEQFVVTVRDGRLSKGMQSFGNSKKVMDNMDNLYAYLKGRSDGAITKSKVKLIQP